MRYFANSRWGSRQGEKTVEVTLNVPIEPTVDVGRLVPLGHFLSRVHSMPMNSPNNIRTNLSQPSTSSLKHAVPGPRPSHTPGTLPENTHFVFHTVINPVGPSPIPPPSTDLALTVSTSPDPPQVRLESAYAGGGILIDTMGFIKHRSAVLKRWIGF
ncbi:hypothetical protein FB446DRAFT_711878 [Lentinula raphanica]|nr:hypothetical protein FB446DRAFT_711878 [Lentinula raphanica]